LLNTAKLVADEKAQEEKGGKGSDELLLRHEVALKSCFHS
jgi:hypothetical protein